MKVSIKNKNKNINIKENNEFWLSEKGKRDKGVKKGDGNRVK